MGPTTWQSIWALILGVQVVLEVIHFAGWFGKLLFVGCNALFVQIFMKPVFMLEALCLEWIDLWALTLSYVHTSDKNWM